MDYIEIIKYVLLIIGSYFFGNISFARILSKFNHKDITKSGSGNPGTMNMLRSQGFVMGLLTLLLDTMKGAVPALVGLLLFNNQIGLYVAGVSVILGHIYPVCYKFKGGKGIACTLGIFLVADPIWLLIFFVLAFIYLWIFDYGSIASLFIISALIIIEGVKNQGNIVISILLFIIFVLTWFAHRKNIKRLLVGKENKANLQGSIKKHFKKQNKEIKSNYKENKQEAKAEFKEEKEKIKDDRDAYKIKKHEYSEEKKKMRLEYRSKKKKVYDYANILELISVQDENLKKDNE